MEVVEEHRCFGGLQRVWAHSSDVLDCPMKLAIYTPPQGPDRPVLLYLSGLTCTEQNVITKAGLQRACAEHGLVLVAPDTSPRGQQVPDDEAYDLGQGAGFYLTATEAPWSSHFRMDVYLMEELLPLVSRYHPHQRWGITGHSMGGHGALVLALKNPGRFASISAFSPILQPCDVPWGRKAFAAYLGADEARWRDHDAGYLLESASERLPLLIDQGGDDPFLDEQLRAERFLATAKRMGHRVSYRLQPGYDHSYYFVATFAPEHVAHHARALIASPG